MRLLMTADAIGGVWQYATELASALAPMGVNTTIALLGPAPSVRPQPVEGRDQSATHGDTCFDKLSMNGTRIVATDLPLDWLADETAVREAGRTIAAMAGDLGADLVQLNSPALAADTRAPCPVIAAAHGCVGTWWQAAHGTAVPADLAWHVALTREGLVAADALVAPSAAYAATLRRRYGLSRTPLAVHNGRTPAALSAAAAPASHALTVGRLWDRVKNAALLDRVAARLPVPLRAAGATTGPHGERVETLHLALLGTLTDAQLAAELAPRPVFVSAARFEPFGLAVLEAAQAGCALVLADIATFRELWDGAALFVAGDDEADWAAAVEGLLGDPAERTRLGAAARERAGRYTPAATATAMAALYRSLLVAKRAAA